ncbi:baseplate J/gp47 family protein [Acetobacter sp.]|uniref:baseplate J/gp47 family protein n=1 Tax=Acetobacter sp. TaxID=440 RepID=UPI0039EC5735
MPYARPTLTQIIDRARQDVQDAGLQSADPLLDPSVLLILSYAFAGGSYEHYGYQDYIAKQATPATATGEYAMLWGALKGVFRKDATAAIIAVSFTGVVGTDLPVGTTITTDGNLSFTTMADAKVDATGELSVPATAQGTGAAYNLAAGAAIGISSPIDGINSSGTVSSIVTSGTDQETEDAFKSRYLTRYASPAQGGSESDYVNWAIAVPGVTRAWCGSPGLFGDATVPIYVMMDATNEGNGGFPLGTNGTSSTDPRYTPATQDLLSVANAIQSEKPVTDILIAVAPLPYPVAITLTGLGGISDTMKEDVDGALADLFLRIGTPFGTTVQGSQIAGALNAIPNIPAFSVLAPVGSITVPVGYLPTVAEPTYQ